MRGKVETCLIARGGSLGRGGLGGGRDLIISIFRP